MSRLAELAELGRALGSLLERPAAGQALVAAAVGLPGPPTPEAHTAVLVMQCPPHAAVYLGQGGMLGGDAADRVAGFWDAIGVRPPPDADHAARLLALQAGLAERQMAGDERTARAAARARGALVREHLASWLPVWLGALVDTGDRWFGEWAERASSWLAAELSAGSSWGAPEERAAWEAGDRGPRPVGTTCDGAPASMAAASTGAASTAAAVLTAVAPAALVEAPPGLHGVAGVDELVEALVSPVRCGMVLSTGRLRVAARAAGSGARVGERRFVLRNLLEQDAPGVLRWAAVEARRWERRFTDWSATDPVVGTWWAARAGSAATVLDELASRC